LSQILEANAPEKYYLSAKACEGILRRAERRGKQLPEILKIALEQQIARELA
jgi:cytidylate kinase